MSKKLEIEPNIVLTIGIEYDKVNLVVKDISDYIIKLVSVPIVFGYNKVQEHKLKQNIAVSINEMLTAQAVDTILMEKCKLSIDKINMFPDPYVLRNILLQYSIQISLEDNFLDRVKYFFEVPQKEWMSTILNRNSTYSIDLFKRHILEEMEYEDELLKIIDTQNFYKTLCFSESIHFKNIANKKYLINKEEI